MRARVRAWFLVGASLLCACRALTEREPNDHFTEANEVRGGARVKGKLGSAADVDVYKIECDRERAVLSVRVGGIREADFVLSVADKERVELKRFDETGIGGDEEAVDVGLKRGTYFVTLSNKNPKANNPDQEYEISFKLDSADGREAEPNDRMLFANALVPGSVTRGHYFPTQNLLGDTTGQVDEDWFSISVATGLFVLNLQVSEVPKVQPVLEIYDANAYKIKELAALDPGEGISVKGLGLKGPAQYFLRLFPRKPRTGTADVAYEILPELVPWRGEGEFEPNDQRLDATPFDRASIQGTINPKGDADWYRVYVDTSAKQYLVAGVTAVPGLDLQLELADELGGSIAKADNGGKEQPELLTGFGVSQGTYYLVVSERTGRGADGRHPYTLSKSIVAWQPGLEYELNNSSRTAQRLEVGSSVDGYIAPKGDVDWYDFNVYQKGKLVVDVTGVVNVQLIATLYDQEFNELGAKASQRSGDSLSLTKDIDRGTFAVRVQAADGAQNNVRDKYTLRVRVQ
ncbi:MAG: hypothetical protein HY078_13210 [Elusimicrobia bacterium]|nr:hypothetical protein [Elusimicrobiota bacterium]